MANYDRKIISASDAWLVIADTGEIVGVEVASAREQKTYFPGKGDGTADTVTHLTVNATTVNAGASGTAGTVQVFPATAASGKTTFTATDNAGDTTTNINTAAQAGARTYTIVDAGASASFVMTAGTQEIGGAKTFTSTTSFGKSGTAGTAEVFPPTATSGKTTFTADDNAGNTTTNVKTAAQAGARTYTVVDAGASASFVMTEGAQTVNGVKTFGSALATSARVGAKNGATVTVVERGDGVFHETELTMATTPVTFTDDAGNGAWAALKLYDFPAGNIVSLGASINADLTLTETWWVDDKAGDVGLGTVATAVGTALTGTTQNIIASTATTAAAQVVPLDTQSTGVGTSGTAGGTDADITLNIRVDDDVLHFPDVVTNGAMAADTDWTKGTGWTIAAGVAASDGTQVADSDLAQAGAVFVEGVTYSVAFTTSGVSAGTVRVVANGTLGTVRSTSATFTESLVAGASGGIIIRADADFVGNIDNVSATPLTGTGTVTGTVTVVWANAGDF